MFDYDAYRKTREEASKFWVLKKLEQGYQKVTLKGGDRLDLELADAHIKSIVREK